MGISNINHMKYTLNLNHFIQRTVFIFNQGREILQCLTYFNGVLDLTFYHILFYLSSYPGTSSGRFLKARWPPSTNYFMIPLSGILLALAPQEQASRPSSSPELPRHLNF